MGVPYYSVDEIPEGIPVVVFVDAAGVHVVYDHDATSSDIAAAMTKIVSDPRARAAGLVPIASLRAVS